MLDVILVIVGRFRHCNQRIIFAPDSTTTPHRCPSATVWSIINIAPVKDDLTCAAIWWNDTLKVALWASGLMGSRCRRSPSLLAMPGFYTFV